MGTGHCAVALTLVVAASVCGACSEASKTVDGDVAGAITVRTGSLPDPCELVPVAEIERLVGKLDGPPERENRGCRYALPADSFSPEWVRARELERALRSQGAEVDNFTSLDRIRPALFVDVDVTGRSIIGERSTQATAALSTAQVMSPGEARTRSWDHAGFPPGRDGFLGRRGQVSITLALQRLRVPRDTLEALARRILARIPDLPFPHPAASLITPSRPAPDPCSLLTREEAEGELGPLVVPPFRSHQETPQVDLLGASCTYHSAGHRVLVLTPEWTFDRSTLDAARGSAGFLAAAADAPRVITDTIARSWDAVVTDAVTGNLIFVSGGRSLTVSYLMSSTDAAGAVRLTELALTRLRRRTP